MKKNTLKKMVSVCCLATLLVGCFAGCGQSGDNTVDTKPAANMQSSDKKSEKITLTVSMPTSWNRGATAEAIKLYEEATGNKVETEVVPDDQHVALMQTRISTNTDVPDIVLQSDNIFTVTQLKEQFVPIEGKWTTKIDPNHLEVGYKKDGVLYEAPYGSASILGLMYNKKVMEEHGIEIPIKSYDALLAACDTLLKAGVTPFSMPSKEGWANQMLLDAQWFTKVTDEEIESFKKGEIPIKELTGCREVFEHAVELCNRGYFNEDHMSTTMDMALEDVATGEAAMCPCGDWSFLPVQTNFPEQLADTGMMPAPMLNDGLWVDIGLSSKCMYIPKAGNSAAALDFVAFVMQENTLRAMYEVEPGACPINNIGTAMNSWNEEMVSYVNNGIPTMPLWPMNPVTYGNCSLYMIDMFNGKTIDDALDDWYRDVSNSAKAAKLEGWT